jgi:hypothetical protein
VLRRIRPLYPTPPVQDQSLQIPPELQYADDADNISTDPAYLHQIKAILETELPKYKLKPNNGKTTITTVNRLGTQNKPWKETKIVGSLLGDQKDLLHRIHLANTAFRTKYPALINKHLSLPTRIRIYRMYIEPIALYNIGCIGLSTQFWLRLDSLQRRHLRSILRIHWPQKITNQRLHEITRTIPWSVTATERRWRLLGHTLRQDPQSPARITLQSTLRYHQPNRKQGRAASGLLTELQKDYLCGTGNELTPNVLPELTRRAAKPNRDEWNKLTTHIIHNKHRHWFATQQTGIHSRLDTTRDQQTLDGWITRQRLR